MNDTLADVMFAWEMAALIGWETIRPAVRPALPLLITTGSAVAAALWARRLRAAESTRCRACGDDPRWCHHSTAPAVTGLAGAPEQDGAR